jgi:hypothetical protein
MVDIMDKDTWANYFEALIAGGCKVLFVTSHYGKPYVYLKDPEGKQFIERIPDELVAEEIERQQEHA